MKGNAKEVAGAIGRNDSLTEKGQLQQAKAEAGHAGRRPTDRRGSERTGASGRRFTLVSRS